MIPILSVLIPTMGVIILGRVFRERLSVDAWRGIDRLNFELLFPCLIFSAAASRPISLDDAAVQLEPASGSSSLLASLSAGCSDPSGLRNFLISQELGRPPGGSTRQSRLWLSAPSEMPRH
jgi:hypothetical protein